MSRQDKATTDRNARTLRELVKQPDNKSCADCRKNDARWASWNLGVYVCIRCSGIHRSMGTHISKVKSIDLDIWTPEQMETIQKWGNKRANLYWERHLKAGHVPPDHKIESFIRSKYESKRWAMEGPPPSDPRVLEEGGGTSAFQPTPTPITSAPPPAPASLSKAHPLLSRTTAARASPAAAAPAPTPAPMLDLFGGDDSFSAPAPTAAPTRSTARPSAQATTGAAAPGPTPTPTTAPTQTPSNLFDLDFRAPTPQSSRPQTAKADILSLYSSSSSSAAPTSGGGSGSFFSPPPAVSQGQNQFASWGGGITSSAPPQTPQQHAQATSSNLWGGAGGAGTEDQNAWGGFSGGAPVQSQAQSGGGAGRAQQNQSVDPWGSSQGGGMDPWGSSGTVQPAVTTAGVQMGGMAGLGAAIKKDDPFANIWQ
ncbi:uncharacterized protein MKK02DRAFT_43147 [Dioszegia hungarica]|uniref:Arf-GAP domain-containing protein n=1 Tax=Dioszegia hungarica TaxID=4972 RepID=A0AA38LTX4_9TREE|nr:uncharacterized protein MKK02DRAFT_43147 [Dioszegia hungarica]KAI9637227.1 hypothetical protein MKK02DRAFT_43147 [Dioszegia hungarica]